MEAGPVSCVGPEPVVAVDLDGLADPEAVVAVGAESVWVSVVVCGCGVPIRLPAQMAQCLRRLPVQVGE